VPVGVGDVVALAELAALGIVEDVGDDAVMLRPAAGLEGRVVDERDRRERGHQMPRPCAFALQAVEVRRRLGRVELGRRKAVEEHDDHRALRRGRSRERGNQQREERRE